MSLYLIIKLLHILTAFWFVSGVIARDFAFWQAGRATNVHAAYALLQMSDFFERWAVISVSQAVVLFGLIAAWLQKWPLLGFLQGAASNWLLVSVLILLVGPLFMIPLRLLARRKQRTQAAEEALARGIITPELMAALNDKIVIRFRAIELVILVIIIVLMVAKPF